MKLKHTIEDLNGIEYVVEFEFYKTYDGQIVYSCGFNVLKSTVFDDDVEIVINGEMTGDQAAILDWLSAGGEDTIYSLAQKKFK
jgi:hypothetical protein